VRTVLVLLLLGGAVAGGAAYYHRQQAVEALPQYRSVALRRGELVSTISATGTVEPEEVVDVGAQVMGLIQEFGVDPQDKAKLIDYGSVVEQGTILARIDPTTYEAALEQAEATLQRAEADYLQLEARFDQAQRDWKRAESLLESKAIAETDYDVALAAYKTAKANLAVGKAAIRQSKAALRIAQTNLGYTTIKSPVRGVIIDRRVNIGQTVVASLNAPSLFLIAKDLRRMQVWASVNEADIGQIREGQRASFTVDAHPGRKFRGRVTQIRMNATMTQNVVTYTVVVTADNSDGKLLPYLTANVQFEVDRRTDVVLAPNAALRWKPPPARIDSGERKTPVSPGEATGDEECGRLWVVTERGLVRPIEVRLGASDNTVTEVQNANAVEGLAVIVGEEGVDGQADDDANDADKTRNPFLPKLPKGAKPPPPP